MNRREVVLAGAAAALVRAGALYAAPATRKKLLLVFLRGAYDAANVLVPISSEFYYRARPNIAVPKPGTAESAAVPLTEDWGLHPALKDSLPWRCRRRAAAPRRRAASSCRRGASRG